MQVTEHPTWFKYHATKLEDYLTCPRYYFYKTICGLRKEDTHNHKAFGSAWHELMVALLLEGYDINGIAAGMKHFLARYRKDFDASTDELFAPKTPNVAQAAAALYVQQYAEKDASQEVCYTEACGAVPLSPTRLIRFKIDSILKDSRGYLSREHKTGSRAGRTWTDQWQLSLQVGTYAHVLFCLYPRDEVWGVEINGTIFQKTQIQFLRVPCRITLPMLNAWLHDINAWIDRIENDVETLLNVDSPDENVMQAFPRNPKSCMDYYGCEFHPFCCSWPNPLQGLDVSGIPLGFYQEFWDPEATTADGDELSTKTDMGVLG